MRPSWPSPPTKPTRRPHRAPRLAAHFRRRLRRHRRGRRRAPHRARPRRHDADEEPTHLRRHQRPRLPRSRRREPRHRARARDPRDRRLAPLRLRPPRDAAPTGRGGRTAAAPPLARTARWCAFRTASARSASPRSQVRTASSAQSWRGARPWSSRASTIARRAAASRSGDGRDDDGNVQRGPRARRALECILEGVGPDADHTKNLLGARWSKLAINCAISSLGTVGGDRLGVLMRHRFVRRLALEIMTEATDVAKASASAREGVGHARPRMDRAHRRGRAAAGSPSLVAKHALLLAVGARYRRLRSSMLAPSSAAAPPSVDFLNGEVVTRGEALGIATPNEPRHPRRGPRRIARGAVRPSFESCAFQREHAPPCGGGRR